MIVMFRGSQLKVGIYNSWWKCYFYKENLISGHQTTTIHSSDNEKTPRTNQTCDIHGSLGLGWIEQQKLLYDNVNMEQSLY